MHICSNKIRNLTTMFSLFLGWGGGRAAAINLKFKLPNLVHWNFKKKISMGLEITNQTDCTCFNKSPFLTNNFLFFSSKISHKCKFTNYFFREGGQRLSRKPNLDFDLVLVDLEIISQTDCTCSKKSVNQTIISSLLFKNLNNNIFSKQIVERGQSLSRKPNIDFKLISMVLKIIT